MRLHSVRFKDNNMPLPPGHWVARGDFVRDMMKLHGCYLQKCFDMDRGCLVWIARFE